MIGSGLAAFVGWDLLDKIVSGAASPRSIVFHPSGHLAYAMLQVASAWSFPSSWSEALSGLVAVVIMVATVVIALSSGARRWVVDESCTSPSRRRFGCGTSGDGSSSVTR